MAEQSTENKTENKELPRATIEEHDRFGFRKSIERRDQFKNWDYKSDVPKPN